jgi:hypothetical protein
VIAKCAVGLDVIYDDGLAVLSYLIADRGFDLQFAAFSQTEVYVVTDGAAHPLLRRYAGDGNEAHARHSADDIQNLWDGSYLPDGVYFRLNVNGHNKSGFALSLSESTRSGDEWFLERICCR